MDEDMNFGTTNDPPSYVTFDLSKVMHSGMGFVTCPRCDASASWSEPDHQPQYCWDCGVEFHYSR